ncbi:hypothetical protein KY348_03410 [Candidatus Woesearchaeota archaeon]|nr:hypothetical protein [Candidatus Woesearchaeota archaeon]
MNPVLIRTSIGNAVYFSFVSFIIIWVSGLLYQGLEKTTGKLSMGTVLIIVLSLILIMFFLAITSIALREPDKKRIKFKDRVMSVITFIITSAIILGVLGFLFWFEV